MTEHTEEQMGYRLDIEADNESWNDPRRDCDNASTMCCDHRRYDLGDKDAHSKARAALRASRCWRESWEQHDLSHGPNLYALMQECDDIVMLPLYLYDHSGITISTSPFSCPWDSGQVGFAFMTREMILKEFGGKRLSQKLREQACRIIRQETKIYDAYLTGDCWQWTITDTETDEVVESCGGYLAGLDAAKEDGRDALKSLANERALRLECV